MNKLKPCPFCGGEATVIICDDEGNVHDKEYETNHWSGLGYMIGHSHEENPKCPIAKYSDDGAEMGVWIYDTKAEAIEAWNGRVNE